MSDRLFDPINTKHEAKHPQFENQTNLMKNIVQTESGEIIEIINGTLHCNNKADNLQTITDWLNEQMSGFDATIKIQTTKIYVDFPPSYPTHCMESLLEHFTYQK